MRIFLRHPTMVVVKAELNEVHRTNKIYSQNTLRNDFIYFHSTLTLFS